jgi:hypothetical protein
MIRLPNVIVIYPQRKSDPGYLLCWIPAREYENVVQDPGARADLAQYYPRGVEVELSAEGLDEYGIDLNADPERLHRAYQDLVAQNAAPESGMVELANLREVSDQPATRSAGGVSFGLSEWMSGVEDLDDDHILRRIAAPPPMTEGEDASQVYRRLLGQQGPPAEGEEGG